MRRLPRIGLRIRLAVALVALALLAVGLATVLGNAGLNPRLSDAARARLQSSADRIASVAGRLYANEAELSRSDALDLEQLSAANGLAVTIVDHSGEQVRTSHSPAQAPPEAVAAPIIAAGREIGHVLVSPAGGGLLSPEERHLQHSLDRLHLVAGAISVAAALVIALLLAHTLSRPLRRIRSTAQRLEQGELDARVGPVGDRDLDEVARALDRLAATLAEEEEIRKRGVADVAHEFRTPVSGILSRTEAALDGVLDDDEQNLEAIHAEALRLRRLLDDLSRLADAEQPGMLIAKEPVDLARIARLQVEVFARRYADKGVELLLHEKSARVLGDADRLNQVIANLLDNALRFTPAGGQVQITVEADAEHATLAIADTGTGIAADDLRHVFKRFWRAEQSRSRRTGGAGIGLAIVHELVAAHGGTIAVESEPGHGTTFSVRLPAVRVTKTTQVPHAATPTG